MQMPNNSTAPPQRRVPLGMILKIIVWLLPLLVAVGVAIFFYSQLQKTKEKIQHAAPSQSAETSRDEIEDTVRKISEVVLLPEGESPTLSTITDINELTENRDFFADAQNGDKVLVYQQAKKAFLYRPSTKKLINLAPINVTDANQAQPTVVAPIDQSPSPEAAEK